MNQLPKPSAACRTALSVGIAAVLLCNCSSNKLRTDIPKNLSIAAKYQDSSFSVRGILEIFEVKPNCDTGFMGRIELNPGSTELGLPVGDVLLLEYSFEASGLMTQKRRTTYATLFLAKPSARYKVEASYVNGMYFVDTKEIPAGKNQGKTVEKLDFAYCEQVMAQMTKSTK